MERESIELNVFTHEQNVGSGQTYFCGIDGSPAAYDALDLVMKDIFRWKSDHLVVGHIFNSQKKYLPFNMKRHYLEDTSLSKIIHLDTWARYVAADCINQQNEVQDVKPLMLQMAHDNKTTVMVTGYNGRKGPKADPTIMGSQVRHLTEESQLPVLVIKDAKRRDFKEGGLFHYGVCYDGSPQAKRALEIAMNMMRPSDKLATITVHEQDIDDSEVQKLVEQKRAELGHTGAYKHIALKNDPKVTVYKQIKEWLKAQTYGPDYIDFICIGNHGNGFQTKKHRMGALAASVITARRMNVLFVPHV